MNETGQALTNKNMNELIKQLNEISIQAYVYRISGQCIHFEDSDRDGDYVLVTQTVGQVLEKLIAHCAKNIKKEKGEKKE